MIDETPLVARLPVEQTLGLEQAHSPTPPRILASADEVQALDQIFARDRESEQVANLLGMWTGTLILVDLAHEHFAADATESFEEEQRAFGRKKKEEPATELN